MKKALYSVAFFSAVTLTAPLAYAEQCRSLNDASKVCRIVRPPVNTPSSITGIFVRGGDKISIYAGGCVQTGGVGKTWKRYVDPAGPNSDRLYHGLISIPGISANQMVRISTLVNRDLQIPSGLSGGGEYAIAIGYEDDDYKDNGYWKPDIGTGDQCAGAPDAWLTVHITHTEALRPTPPIL